MAVNPQTKSPLFRLPPETRLHIYNYLIPNNILYIDLCTKRGPNADTFFGVRRTSPISTLRQQLDTLNEITHVNGLHLLLVSRRTRSEVLELFTKSAVRFHCVECFKTFLPNVARGLGVGVDWMKHVEIIFDLTQTRQMGWGQYLTPALARTMTREALRTCQKTVWCWYGRLNLTEQEKWSFMPLMEKEGDDGDSVRSMSTTSGRQQQDTGFTQTGQLLTPAGVMSSTAIIPTRWLISVRFDI